MKKYALYILIFSVAILIYLLAFVPFSGSLSLVSKGNILAGEANSLERIWGITLIFLGLHIFLSIIFFIIFLTRQDISRMKWLALFQILWVIPLFFIQFVDLTCYAPKLESPPPGLSSLTEEQHERLTSTTLTFPCDTEPPRNEEVEWYGTQTVNPLFYASAAGVSFIMLFVSLYFILKKP